MKFNLSYAIVLLLLLGFSEARATHIVGGEMTYRCLGNGYFEISLTVFRDCYYGEPPFDSPASIGVFAYGDSLVSNLLVTFPGSDTLEPILESECYVIPPDVCVEQTTYIDTVFLPFVPGGYTLAYQRCCRNATIANIITPLDIGATYMIQISEDALLECNTSATFIQWPPILICVNDPIVFDHSAIDTDGDSLAYRLCTPLEGATPSFPNPSPPAAPPYVEVPWQDPPYNLDNILGGVPLTINAVTGLLTGTPLTVGQFVVGVCVDEFQEGDLISTTRRDFQYNVGICGEVAAAFAAPSLQCGGNTVEFDNLGLPMVNYLWIFNDPQQPGAVSGEFSPSFTFSGPGTYNVILIADPMAPCADTLELEVTLQPASLSPAMSTYTGCDGTEQVLYMNSNSTDSLFNITSEYFVLYLPDGSIDTLDATNLQLVNYSGIDGFATVWTFVQNEAGCIDSVYFQEFLAPITDQIPPQIIICGTDSVTLNASADPNNTFVWSPAMGLSSTTSPSPIAYPPSPVAYTAVVTSPTGCQVAFVVEVSFADSVYEFPEIDTFFTCNGFGTATYALPADWEIIWARDREMTQILSETATLDIEDALENYSIYLNITTPAGCTHLDSMAVMYTALAWPDTVITLPCPAETVNLVLPSVPGNSLVTWEPASDIVAQTPQQAVASLTNGTEFRAIVEYNAGCFDTIGYSVVIANPNPLLELFADSSTINQTDTVLVWALPLGFADYSWQLSGDALWQSQSGDEIRAALNQTTLFTLSVIDENGCTATDTLTVHVRPSICEEPYLFIPNGFTPNNDGQNDTWLVYGAALSTLEVRVYDRWGREVFSSTDLNTGWDGTLQGTPLAPDVYAYHLTAECIGGTRITRQGNISLIR